MTIYNFVKLVYISTHVIKKKWLQLAITRTVVTNLPPDIMHLLFKANPTSATFQDMIYLENLEILVIVVSVMIPHPCSLDKQFVKRVIIGISAFCRMIYYTDDLKQNKWIWNTLPIASFTMSRDLLWNKYLVSGCRYSVVSIRRSWDRRILMIGIPVLEDSAFNSLRPSDAYMCR